MKAILFLGIFLFSNAWASNIKLKRAKQNESLIKWGGHSRSAFVMKCQKGTKLFYINSEHQRYLVGKCNKCESMWVKKGNKFYSCLGKLRNACGHIEMNPARSLKVVKKEYDACGGKKFVRLCKNGLGFNIMDYHRVDKYKSGKKVYAVGQDACYHVHTAPLLIQCKKGHTLVRSQEKRGKFWRCIRKGKQKRSFLKNTRNGRNKAPKF